MKWLSQVEADEAEPSFDDPSVILWNSLLYNSVVALENFVLVSIWFYTSVEVFLHL